MQKKLKKVLLIDDEPGQRRLLKKMFLEGGDFEVIEAMDGLDALNILLRDKLRPDLMLVDLTMPYIDGLEFIRIIKNKPELNNLPIMICSRSGKHSDSSGNCPTWYRRHFDKAGR